jgi:dUTP pyrophosphatase
MTDDRDQPAFASHHAPERATPLAQPCSRSPVVIFEKLAPDVEFPRRATERAIGYDLKAYLMGTRVKLVCGSVRERGPDPEADVPQIRFLPGVRVVVPTGLRVAVPEGYEMQIRPCARMTMTKGLTLIGASGTLGPDDREEIAIFLRNSTGVTATVEHGECIARAVFVPVAQLPVLEGLIASAGHGGDDGAGSAGAP